jgi:disulfide bond formation protein DsbB
MKKLLKVINNERTWNALELTGIICILTLAILIQLILKDFPCPLCFLQRIGLCCVALGFLMNLRFGLRPSHYGIVILSAIFTSLVSLQQIAINLDSETGGMGAPVFGLHLYTWCFIISMIIVIVTAILLCGERNYADPHSHRYKKPTVLIHTLFAVLVMLILSNIATVYDECGFAPCQDAASAYKPL